MHITFHTQIYYIVRTILKMRNDPLHVDLFAGVQLLHKHGGTLRHAQRWTKRREPLLLHQAHGTDAAGRV